MVGAGRVLDQNFENEKVDQFLIYYTGQGKFHGYFCCKQHPHILVIYIVGTWGD